jgi:hypothetical protein
MTPKQHVLSIYPNAKLEKEEGDFYYISAWPSKLEYKRFGYYFPQNSPKKAWLLAWKQIQAIMLERLAQ